MEKVIKLSGRIDSTNSQEIEKRISLDLEGFNGDVIFDAKDLEYISSAGLRVILRFKKMNDSTKVINCNSQIFETFEMTGFSEMMDISKVFREVSVDGCEIIGTGSNGKVYRIDPETIVKVYNVKNSLETIKRERELARKAFVLGIPTAIPYDVVKVGDLYGSVFELLNAKSFANLINEGEDVDKLVSESVEILKKIHSINLEENELPSKRLEQIKKAEFVSKYLPEKTGRKLIKLIEDVPEETNLLHGDFQVKNIMKQNGEILLIDMDTLSIGHPIFEFGAIYAAYKAYSCIDESNPAEFFGITREQCNTFLEDTFKYYFNDTDIENIKRRASILSYLQVLNSLTLRTSKIDDNKQAIDYCVKYLTENVENIDSLIQ